MWEITFYYKNRLNIYFYSFSEYYSTTKASWDTSNLRNSFVLRFLYAPLIRIVSFNGSQFAGSVPGTDGWAQGRQEKKLSWQEWSLAHVKLTCRPCPILRHHDSSTLFLLLSLLFSPLLSFSEEKKKFSKWHISVVFQESFPGRISIEKTRRNSWGCSKQICI